ncbi:MAG: EamA family transporter [bacterium]|nr:EamA family transporter [bacterium]MDZ4296113.1 EamA family transporter [Patescibacteria group bacterium]
MPWLPIAITAQFILGSSAVFDKLLLRQRFFNPWAYTFWLGILGVFAFALLPFNYSHPPSPLVLRALGAGAIFIIALLLLFMALKMSEASQILPLVGGLSPLATFAASALILNEAVSRGDLIGFLMLVAGGLLILLSGWGDFSYRSLVLAAASTLLFGLANVLTKTIFDATTFATGFFWIKIGGVLAVLCFLAVPAVRRSILNPGGSSGHPFRSLANLAYLGNRGYAAVGSVLVYVAIFLAHPALVDATQGLRYIVIFAFSWALLGERAAGALLGAKLTATALIVIGLVWLGTYSYLLPSLTSY